MTQKGRQVMTEATETTDSPTHRREQAALQLAIAEKACEGCGAVGQWQITHTAGQVRSLKCRKCDLPSKVVPDK